MRVKMKIKHIIAVLTGFVGLLALFIFVMSPNLSNSNAQQSEKGDLFAQLETLSGEERWKRIEEDIISRFRIKPYDVYKTAGSTELTNLSENKNEEWIPFIREYIEEIPEDKKRPPQNGYYKEAVEKLAKYYEKKQNWEEATKVLSQGMDALPEDTDGYQTFKVQKLLVESYQHPASALEKLNEIKPYEVKEYQYAELLKRQTKLLMDAGQLDEAHEKLTKGMEYMEQNHAVLQSIQERLEAWKNGEDLVTYQGKLQTDDGKPLSHAKVFLVNPDRKGNSFTEKQSPSSITDDQGNFKIEALPKGDYQLMLGMTLDQVDGYTWPVESDEWLDVQSDVKRNITLPSLIKINSPINDQMVKGDKVEFSWEPVEDAAYYQLHFGIQYEGGGITTTASEHIESNAFEMSKQAFLFQSFGTVQIMDGDGEMQIVPESLLGLSNPNVDMYWYVDAYNKQGEILTSSNGFRLSKENAAQIPYFHYEKQSLTEADELLLDGKLDEAFAAYKKDENDLHSQRMIYEIISSDRDMSRYEQLQGALPYLKELAKRTDLKNYWHQLATHAYLEGDWERYRKFVEKQDEREIVWDGYDWGKYAIVSMKMGKDDEAEQYFLNSLEEDGTNRFSLSYAMLELHRTGSFEKAQQIVEKYPERSLSSQDWAKRLEEIKRQVEQSAKTKELFQQGLNRYTTDGHHTFKQWVNQLDNELLSEFFEELE
ncbi:carboxypeptidase-like regulatory domain-containing protein [Pontibacillus yanchengensis]|uniref:Uncharacterized protein n=1 Tax=Pontibacillus yanchengensis Y32 TaxID=1385514 RepID=A0A0A2TGJ4_9BACI|nr:carboxypeptidase-like regulatory domain-containing protein [Pontibacillus yanchengensis]KGP74694.1 hypothetical protein N782_00595 [Pontibacillus yanchengensis Y32]